MEKWLHYHLYSWEIRECTPDLCAFSFSLLNKRGYERTKYEYIKSIFDKFYFYALLTFCISIIYIYYMYNIYIYQ